MANWNLEAAAGAPGSSLLWRGTWSSALSYNPRDGVLASNGCSYVSKTNNQNKDPVSNPSDWDMIASIGNPGSPAFTTTAANFDVPAVGGSVVVTMVDASWVTIGQMVVVETAGGGPANAYSFKVVAKAGNQVTLQNIATTYAGAGIGDMLKSVYDADVDSIVDAAETLSESPVCLYQDHFLTGSDASYGCWIASGTGANKGQSTSSADHPGVYAINTGTSNGAAATGYVFMTAGNGYTYGTGALAFRSVFLPSSVKPTSAAAQLSKVLLGMGTQPTNGTYPGADFVGFVFDPSSGMANAANNWGLLTRKASVSTYTDTGLAYTFVYADLSFYADATGVYFKAYAWGGAVPAKSAAITSNVPLAATPLCMVLHALNGAAGTTNYQHFIDLWEVAYRGNTAVSVFRGGNLLRNF
jgi:hypothetical protein